MKKIKNILAFTLVELIVVITIVGILSTVGFVSYSGYLAGARDSNRFSQLTKLSDSLQVYAATKSLPLPDDYIEVTASGTVIAYQGYVGVDVLETIDYTNGGKDPKDKSYFTYYLKKNRKHMQLLAFMEEESSVTLNTQSYAADYTERVPKVYGKKLGVLTEITSNTPIQEVSGLTGLDIVTTTDFYISHISDSVKLEGTGATLQASISNGNCGRIKQTGGSYGNGMYTINPNGEGEISVYCDMESKGEAWTILFSVNSFGNTWKYDSTQWSSPNIDSILSDIEKKERTSIAYSAFKTNEIAICRGMENCFIMKHNLNRTLESFYDDSESYTDFSRGPDGEMPTDFGTDRKDEYFSSLDLTYTLSTSFDKYGVGINLYSGGNRLGFQADNNNLWPSVDNIVIGIGGFAAHPSNIGCQTLTSPFSGVNALSVMVPGKCMYEGVGDTEMWYVKGR